MYTKFMHNRIFKLLICLLMSVVFVVVPIEHSMLTAQAAITEAIALGIICSCIIALGITVGGLLLKSRDAAQFSALTYGKHCTKSLAAVAKDIWDSSPNVRAAITAAISPNASFAAAMNIIAVNPEIFRAIKEYISQKYGSSAEEVAENMSLTANSFFDPLFVFRDYYIYNFSADPSYCMPYPTAVLEGSAHGWVYWSTNSDHTYQYYPCTTLPDGTVNTYGRAVTVSDPAKLAVVLRCTNFYAPDQFHTHGYFIVQVGWTVDGSLHRASSYEVNFNSIAEYETCSAYYNGTTDVDELRPFEVDKNLWNTSVSSMPRYVYVDGGDIMSMQNSRYIGKTAADIIAPAYSETVHSTVVDAASRTLTWEGDRTLCPIDDLEAALPAWVIGHWVGVWDELSNLCNITCYAEDGSVAWTGDVATTMTWAQALERLSDIAINGTAAVTAATAATTAAAAASIAMPNVAINLDPLKMAVDIVPTKFPFCLPFDLWNAFKQFDYEGEGEAPRWVFPLNFGETFGTHYITIDLASWSSVAAIVKWTVYVSFMVSLIVVTKKVLGDS